jgi:hypothetical protein
MTQNDQPTYRKEIVYDRTTKDFAAYLDSELVGFYRTYHDAEIALDALVVELIGLNRPVKEAE